MTISTKRVAPGHNNTWFIRIVGTRNSAAFSTANPKVLRTLPYDSPGQAQAWHVRDVPFASCYPTVTGAIFEFGFPDAILQMWAAFCDELAGGKAGPFGCVTPAEAADHHAILTAALHSHERDAVVRPEYRA